MSDSFSITGNIVQVSDVQVISETFSKRSFVVEVIDDKYPQYIQLELAGKNVSKGDGLTKGSEVTAHFNVRGRKYQDKKTGEDKFFTSLDCWRIEVVKKAEPQASIEKELGW